MGLYLVPASSENINKSLLNGTDISVAKKFLLDSEYNKLIDLLKTEKQFYCWAMTEPSRSKFERMEKGDIVLFSEKNTGLFTYQAEVLFTIENEDMGNFLWDYTPNKPWKLIYFLHNVQKIRIDKSTLVQALGYKSNFTVPGVISAKESSLKDEIEKKGSIPNDLKSYISEWGNEEVFPLKSVVSKEKHIPIKQDYEQPETFMGLIKDILILQGDSEHKERAHESLVEHFCEILNFDKHTEIKYRQGRVDISLSYQNKILVVIEVKKNWHLSYKDKNTVKQGYGYAIENGARFVVISNGDYYAIFDRTKGLNMDSNFIGEFRLTKLTKDDLFIIDKLRKENLSNIH